MITESGGEIVRIKDRFTSPSGGYKDILINVRMPNGLVTEILVTTEAIAEAKNGIGHKLYEAGQIAQEKIDFSKLTDEEKIIAKLLMRNIENASIAFYESIGEESNSMASSSVIVYPLKRASTLLEELSSSSVYPEIASLLGSILYTEPSAADIKGISSYSTNLSTMTGMLGPSDSQGVPTASLPSTNNALNGADDITLPPVEGETITPQEAESNTQRGATITVILADGTEMPGRYELREAEVIIPSHDALHNFEKREDYPADTQERPYHSNLDEQLKVRNNAANLNVAMVINNNPDAVNGPPIVTENGVVLGGNSRAMSLQLVYAEHEEHAKAYKDALKSMASIYGLDPAGIDAMQRPMLVRVLDGDMDQKQQARLVRTYRQTDMGDQADQILHEDVAAWGQSVDSLAQDTLNRRENMIMLRQTPLVLQMLDAQNLPVHMGPGKLLRVMRKHNLSAELVKQIPAAMADPIMVFRSSTQGGDLLLMLELKDNAGATVNVPVALELEGTSGYRVNMATTVFGRQKNTTEKPDNQWFVNQISLGNLLYRNNKKSRDWARTSGLQLPGANTRTNSAGRRIYTDEDFINLRRKSPEMYQEGSDARGRIAFSTPSGRSLITLFQKADASTFLHESGHLYKAGVTPGLNFYLQPSRYLKNSSLSMPAVLMSPPVISTEMAS